MELKSVAFGVLATLLVIGVIVVVSTQTALFVTTHTERFTTTTTVSGYATVELVGDCSATTYVVPDTEVIMPTNVTVTSGSSTSYYLSTSTIYPGTSTLGSTTYSTSTYANGTEIIVVTTTSEDLNYFPSVPWTVTVCTYSP
jgi:hypothetical protein